MAALGGGLVAPGGLARRFLRHTTKLPGLVNNNNNNNNPSLNQRCRLHSVVVAAACPGSRVSRVNRVILLATRSGGRRPNGSFLLVNAAAVRHGSTQIPAETFSMMDDIPAQEALHSPVLPDHATPVLLTEQSSVASISTATPAAPPPLEATPILDAAAAAVPPMGWQADATLLVPPPLGEALLAPPLPTAAEVLGEPTLAELGLACHTPVGLIQNLLEFMHVDLGMPWWGAIVVDPATPTCPTVSLAPPIT